MASEPGKKSYYVKKPREENRNFGPKPRKGFDVRGGVICKQCFKKNLEIDLLKQENARLKEKLKRAKHIEKYGYFGNQTPSSKKPHKSNSTEESRNKRGGAKIGHIGHGRLAHDSESADEVIEVQKPDSCPNCDVALYDKDIRERSIIDSESMKAKRILYRCKRGCCPRCGKIYTSRIRALPKCLYGNALTSQAATQHYVYGTTLGKLERMFGEELVSASGLIEAFHRLGKLCEEAIPSLIDRYRSASVKHADETGWRTDGSSGWAWIFSSPDTTLLQLRSTRGRKVVEEILGDRPLPGVLVVDRMPSYNRAPCKMQYCFAHLLREVQKVADEFAENIEVCAFTENLAALVSECITLRRYAKTDVDYYRRAHELKKSIQKMVAMPTKHEAILHLQEIFSKRERRMYHWAEDRAVPADNNQAEREIRPTVIARKVSFGSQSDKGAKTRGAIMSVLYTAMKRNKTKPPDVLLQQFLERRTQDKTYTVAAWLDSLR